MPAPHASFAAAILLGEEFLQAVVAAQFDAQQLPNLPVVANTLSGALYIDVPTVRCRATRPGALEVAARAWGRLTRGTEQHDTTMDIEFAVPVSASTDAVGLKLAFDSAGVEVLHVSATSMSGGAFTAAFQADLDSSTLRASLRSNLAVGVFLLSLAVPSIPLELLGGLLNAPQKSVKLRCVDGCLCLGVDVFMTPAHGLPVMTSGDVASLVDDRRGSSLAVWLNPAACAAAFEPYSAPVKKAAQAAGATLVLFLATTIEGALLIAASIAHQQGNVNVTATLVPRLSTASGSDGVHFEAVSVNVNLQPAWYISFGQALLGIFTLGIGAMVVENMLFTIREGVRVGVVAGTRKRAIGRDYSIGTGRAAVDVTIDRIEPHADGMLFGAKVDPRSRAGALDVPGHVSIDAIQAGTVGVRLALPFGVHLNDPFLRVSWTARRLDTNTIVAQFDGRPQAARAEGWIGHALDLRAHPDAQLFNVSCRLYRLHGGDLFAGTSKMKVFDRIDRTRPFVRWTHVVTTPIVRVMPDGTKVYLGFNDELRHSAIHKTKVPGRCRMVAKFSPKVHTQRVGNEPWGYLEYLDALPVALPGQRDAVCDYCFYGGPTKNALLP